MNLENRKAGKESIENQSGIRFVSGFPAFQIQEISSILG